jgi:phage major head subunit gpT-like protein
MSETLKTIELSEANDVVMDLTLDAAQTDSNGQKSRRFTMLAYSGEKMRISGWSRPVVANLSGLRYKSHKPVFFDHDKTLEGLVGQTDRIEVVDNRLIASGLVVNDSALTAKVMDLNDKGFRWSCSIGTVVQSYREIDRNEKVTVNGQEYVGPFTLVEAADLTEISFVISGAAESASAYIAAKTHQHNSQQESDMDNPKEKTETTPELKVEAKQPAPPIVDVQQAIDEMRASMATETERINAIADLCAGQHGMIQAQAIREGWSKEKTELEVLRASRPSAPNIHAPAGCDSMQMLEAAALMSGGISGDDLLKSHGEKVVEAADKRYKRRMGLQQMLLEAAMANGYAGTTNFKGDARHVLEAAFSTMDLPGIMSNVANKFLLQGFKAIESNWRRISSTRNVSDFKAITSYRMTGGFEFQEVGPTGELKHAKVDEESFTNQAKTHGIMFAVTRTDLYNDDMDALTKVPQRIGRGGHIKLNKVFWADFLNNGTFFTTARKNYKTGTDTVLSIDGLTAAELLFLDQKDPDGNPLAIQPKILLVPNALKTPARQLMSSQKLGRDDEGPEDNPWAGAFELVNSSYLTTSAKAWYLLADPSDLSLIEVCFLNGVQQPTVESADADFNVLGIQFRGYFDFGVSKQDWRAGVKMKGEA